MYGEIGAGGQHWGAVLEWSCRRNCSLYGGKAVFHALLGGSHHSDQENDIFTLFLINTCNLPCPQVLAGEAPHA